MRRTSPPLQTIAVAVALALSGLACGDSAYGDDDTYQDAATSSDAASSSDAANGNGDAIDGCQGYIRFSPLEAYVGDDVIAYVELAEPPSDPVSYAWSVVDPDGTPLDCTGADSRCVPFGEGGSQLRLHLELRHVYQVSAEVTSGQPCFVEPTSLDVGLPPHYRLRFTPQPGQGAPPQDEVVDVTSGVDLPLGEITLSPGLPMAGTVLGFDGAPMAAYLRFTPAGGGPAVETFSTTGGEFDGRIGDGLFDVLIVPAVPGRAPALIPGVIASSNLVFIVPDAPEITGTVLDAAGDPVVGATVSARVGGLPSTLATTDGGGAFSLRARPPGPFTLTVAPATGSLLPRLDIGDGDNVELAGGTSLAIQYEAVTPRQLQGLALRDASGAPAASAAVTFLADLGAAGSVAIAGGGTVAPHGSVRVALATDSLGGLPLHSVPAAAYRIVIDPPGETGTVAIAVADLTSDVPAEATAAPRVATSGSVVDIAGNPIGGAAILAIPTGDLAGVDGGGAGATTASDGSFSLDLVDGQRYDLRVAAEGHAAVREPIQVPAGGGAVEALALPDAVVVSGTLSLPGGEVAVAVNVSILCYRGCTGPDAWRPLAETATGVDGSYRLLVPDPGTGGVDAGP